MDKERIYNGFAQILRNDVRAVISVLPFDNNVRQNDGQILKISTLVHQNVHEILLDGETLTIPTRIYLDEPNPYEENTLNELQKTILNCIYLRHHDGYTRQKRLNTLAAKNHYFNVPYAFPLLGEYIIEIINDIDDFIDETNIHLFRKFLSENRSYSTLTKNRMISYWNEYYRFGENRNIRDYIGRRIFDRLENN